MKRGGPQEVLGVHRCQPHGHSLHRNDEQSVRQRRAQHKSGEIEGFSSDYKCNRLVYWERFDDVLKAINREKQLKGWRRAKKIVPIESINPRWADLAEKWGAEMAFAGQSITAR